MAMNIYTYDISDVSSSIMWLLFSPYFLNYFTSSGLNIDSLDYSMSSGLDSRFGSGSYIPILEPEDEFP